MKNLVLLGTGQAHVQLLSRLARKPVHDIQITLIAPYPVQLFAPMVPGFVAGHYALEECVIALEVLLKRAGVRWLNRPVAALDAGARTIQLDTGSTFSFDALSINIDLAPDRQQIEAALPGAREHGLFLRPLASFGALWPRVASLGTDRALRIAVLGATHEAMELALAVRQRLPNAAVTLLANAAEITGPTQTAAQDRRVALLKKNRVTLLPDVALRIEAEQIVLASGARLACDVPLLASPGQAPGWLAHSGLRLDQDGFVALDACQRSLSHPNVYAAMDHAGRADAALVRNLAALLAGTSARPARRSGSAVRFTAYGDRRALLEWGRFSAQGRWAGWLKDWLDRRYLQRYRLN